MKRIIIATCLVSFAVLGVQAQTLSGLKVEPAAPKVGEQVKITLDFTNADAPNCGMKIMTGDGRAEEARINQAKDVPFVLTHTYAKAGSFTVIAEPKRAGSVLKCAGKNINKVVTVAAGTAPAVAAAPGASAAKPAAPAAAALCPEGWALVKPGQNAKTKAFTCNAKPGTKIPEPKLSCPGDLTYFDNSKKGQLGCRV